MKLKEIPGNTVVHTPTVGDKAIFPSINEPLTIHAIMGDVAYSWCDDGSVRCAAILDVLKPYTEPETKPTEDMETKRNRNLSQDVANCDKPEDKELNLSELLQGHEGEEFYTTSFGNVTLERINGNDTSHPILISHEVAGLWNITKDGRLHESTPITLYPSRALFEQYPLDPYAAWQVWLDEQKPILMSVTLGAMGDGNTIFKKCQFRTPADRDKCIEEIKEILKKY